MKANLSDKYSKCNIKLQNNSNFFYYSLRRHDNQTSVSNSAAICYTYQHAVIQFINCMKM